MVLRMDKYLLRLKGSYGKLDYHKIRNFLIYCYKTVIYYSVSKTVSCPVEDIPDVFFS